NQERTARRWRRVVGAAECPQKPPRKIREHGHEEDARNDHCQGDEEAPPHELRGRESGERVEDPRQLKTDEDEEQGIENEGEDLPGGSSLKPRLEGGELRRAPAEVDAGGDHCEHAGG